MTRTLIITLFAIVSVVATANAQEDYNIETIERNISRSHDAEGSQSQEEYSDAMNEANHTNSSPQINIYNANSNANKQKSQLDAAADANAENSVVSDIAVDNKTNNEYLSRTNDIRNARKSMEIGTEAKMVEKLEWSRIEDEKDRADRLFGNRLDKNYGNDYKKEEPKVIVVEKPAYVAPAYQEPAPEYKAPAKKVEPTATYEVSDEYETKSAILDGAYVAPMIGTLNYSADNVRADSAFGIAIGSRVENISFEGSFLYGELEMDDYTIQGYNNWGGAPVYGLKEVTQYGFGAAVKYNFGSQRISPFVGALGTYTMRDYQETRLGSGTAESTAFDAGLAVGVDVRVAKNFSVGLEYRIMKNITNDREEQNQWTVQQAQFRPATAGKKLEPLEEVNQSMLLLNGKFNF